MCLALEPPGVEPEVTLIVVSLVPIIKDYTKEIILQYFFIQGTVLKMIKLTIVWIVFTK